MASQLSAANGIQSSGAPTRVGGRTSALGAHASRRWRRALTLPSNDPPRSPATKAAAVAPKVPRVESRPGDRSRSRVAWNPQMPAGSAPNATNFGHGEYPWAGVFNHPRRFRAECGARRQLRQLPQTNLAYQMYPMKKDE